MHNSKKILSPHRTAATIMIRVLKHTTSINSHNRRIRHIPNMNHTSTNNVSLLLRITPHVPTARNNQTIQRNPNFNTNTRIINSHNHNTININSNSSPPIHIMNNPHLQTPRQISSPRRPLQNIMMMTNSITRYINIHSRITNDQMNMTLLNTQKSRSTRSPTNYITNRNSTLTNEILSTIKPRSRNVTITVISTRRSPIRRLRTITITHNMTRTTQNGNLRHNIIRRHRLTQLDISSNRINTTRRIRHTRNTLLQTRLTNRRQRQRRQQTNQNQRRVRSLRQAPKSISHTTIQTHHLRRRNRPTARSLPTLTRQPHTIRQSTNRTRLPTSTRITASAIATIMNTLSRSQRTNRQRPRINSNRNRITSLLRTISLSRNLILKRVTTDIRSTRPRTMRTIRRHNQIRLTRTNVSRQDNTSTSRSRITTIHKHRHRLMTRRIQITHNTRSISQFSRNHTISKHNSLNSQHNSITNRSHTSNSTNNSTSTLTHHNSHNTTNQIHSRPTLQISTNHPTTTQPNRNTNRQLHQTINRTNPNNGLHTLPHRRNRHPKHSTSQYRQLTTISTITILISTITRKVHHNKVSHKVNIITITTVQHMNITINVSINQSKSNQSSRHSNTTQQFIHTTKQHLRHRHTSQSNQVITHLSPSPNRANNLSHGRHHNLQLPSRIKRQLHFSRTRSMKLRHSHTLNIAHQRRRQILTRIHTSQQPTRHPINTRHRPNQSTHRYRNRTITQINVRTRRQMTVNRTNTSSRK